VSQVRNDDHLQAAFASRQRQFDRHCVSPGIRGNNEQIAVLDRVKLQQFGGVTFAAFETGRLDGFLV